MGEDIKHCYSQILVILLYIKIVISLPMESEPTTEQIIADSSNASFTFESRVFGKYNKYIHTYIHI